MADFEDVEFIENLEETISTGPQVAPEGDYVCKIVESTKYKSKAGNYTVKITYQVDGGNYRDHTEYYNLWHPNEQTRKISNEIFTRITKAVGFQKYPSNSEYYVGKELVLGLRTVDETWQDSDGNERTSAKNKVKYYKAKPSEFAVKEEESKETKVSPPPF
tara:strand:+ start:1265 stop:1747 length:483 start_codon:yes stop_codon:yes gene_type:complete